MSATFAVRSLDPAQQVFPFHCKRLTQACSSLFCFFLSLSLSLLRARTHRGVRPHSAPDDPGPGGRLLREKVPAEEPEELEVELQRARVQTESGGNPFPPGVRRDVLLDRHEKVSPGEVS